MIEARHVDKVFMSPSIQVLFDLNFKVNPATFTVITGRSGSGKSTLLYLLSTLDQPSQGEILFDGKSVTDMSEAEIHLFRNQQMGFVFQFHYLLSELSAIENVLIPARKSGEHRQRRAFAESILSQFGLQEKLQRLPKEMSGGEQQRVAIARALVMEPRFIFADEPTGNLDSINGNTVMEILKNITRTSSTTVVYVTHDADFANMADQKLHLVDGRLQESSLS